MINNNILVQYGNGDIGYPRGRGILSSDVTSALWQVSRVFQQPVQANINVYQKCTNYKNNVYNSSRLNDCAFDASLIFSCWAK